MKIYQKKRYRINKVIEQEIKNEEKEVDGLSDKYIQVQSRLTTLVPTSGSGPNGPNWVIWGTFLDLRDQAITQPGDTVIKM